jgi:hypothetical protein
LTNCINRGLAVVRSAQEDIQQQIQDVARVEATLHFNPVTVTQCQAQFAALGIEFQARDDPIHRHMARVMASFAPGLFAGPDLADLPQDNLDLERWFRQPKSHERRIHGHKHAGVRIVQEGATLLPVLDAHLDRNVPFTAAELLPYRLAAPPLGQQQAILRRKVMRKARSTKKRAVLLADLERRYCEGV